jgi:glycosyltransferase involved in cell wall biosynthesis
LPGNVTVLSLGKETGASRWKYLKNFYTYIFQYRKEYDHVFVHMNPEYVCLGGIWWRVWHKKVILWYAHKAVNLRLRLGTVFATKIFTSSKEGFRLPSAKVDVVGQGIAVQYFASIAADAGGRARRLLWVGRVSPVKDLETVVLAMRQLALDPHDPPLTLDIVGSAITASDRAYEGTIRSLVERAMLADRVRFVGGVPYGDMARLYQEHSLLIHTSKTGSMDKVVLEALAAGMHVVTSSEAYRDLVAQGLAMSFRLNQAADVAATIEKAIQSGILKQPNQKGIDYVRTHHNLDSLIGKIMAYFSGV